MEKGHAICIAGIRSATQKQAATQWEERFRDRGRKSRVSEGARSCSGQIPKERDRKKEKQHLTQKGRLTQKCRWTQLNSNDCSTCKDLTGEEGILGRKLVSHQRNNYYLFSMAYGGCQLLQKWFLGQVMDPVQLECQLFTQVSYSTLLTDCCSNKMAICIFSSPCSCQCPTCLFLQGHSPHWVRFQDLSPTTVILDRAGSSTQELGDGAQLNAKSPPPF